MSRLTAILLLGLALSGPALGADEGAAPTEGQAAPEAAAAASDPAAGEIPGLEELPAEVLERLEPEEISEILQAREDTAVVRTVFDSVPSGAMLTAVPLAFFLTILLGVVSTLLFRYRKHGQLQETLRLMIEKGADIPPGLITPPLSPYGDLRRGLTLVGAGLSLMIFLGLVVGFDTGVWAVGLIPAFIGAGYLIVWGLSRRAESR
jgi:hypothetical protein